MLWLGPVGVVVVLPPCKDHRQVWDIELADAIVPITYGSDGVTPQIRRFLRQYKNGSTPEERSAAYGPLTFLFWQFLYRHRFRLDHAARGPIDGFVASGAKAGRSGEHPIEALALYFPDGWKRPVGYIPPAEFENAPYAILNREPHPA